MPRTPQERLSRPPDEWVVEAMLIHARALLLDYFDSIDKMKEIKYYDFLAYAGLKGQLPNRRLHWDSHKLSVKLMNSKMKCLYGKYKRGALAETISATDQDNRGVGQATAYANLPSQRSH